MRPRNCGEYPGWYASLLKCCKQILLHDEGLNSLRLQNSIHTFLLRFRSEMKKNLFHLDFFGCRYYNRIPDTTCCSSGLHTSETQQNYTHIYTLCTRNKHPFTTSLVDHRTFLPLVMPRCVVYFFLFLFLRYNAFTHFMLIFPTLWLLTHVCQVLKLPQHR